VHILLIKKPLSKMSQNESNSQTFQTSLAPFWYARLELGFCFENSRTIMSHRKHHGPVRVQKMLWPEKTGVCHAIIVHPPAGIAGGDHLTFQIETKIRRMRLLPHLARESGIKQMENRLSAYSFHVKDDSILSGCRKKQCCLMEL
jgi:urease accessory protein